VTVLVVGASGATGRQVVKQLLTLGQHVRIVVRTDQNLPSSVTAHENLSVIHASVLDLRESEMKQHVSDCKALVSCLGHNLSFKGVFGPPRNLVADGVRRLCDAVKGNNPKQPVKFVLMNTSGNRNRDLNERVSWSQKYIIWLLRHLLPPHADNENAADYLRTKIGQNDAAIEWVAVRPDSLIDDAETSEYEVHPSPIRSAIFDAGVTSRINVGHFIAELITDDKLWKAWKGRMPVIYNKELPKAAFAP
jgi:hypothetical protein